MSDITPIDPTQTPPPENPVGELLPPTEPDVPVTTPTEQPPAAPPAPTEPQPASVPPTGAEPDTEHPQDGDNFEAEYAQHRENTAVDADEQAVLGAFGLSLDDSRETAAAPGDGKEKPPPAPDKNPVIEGGKSAALDIVHGAMEFPHQVIGGFTDGIHNTLQMVDEVGNWLEDKAVDFLKQGWLGEEDGKKLLGEKGYEKWLAEKGTPSKITESLPAVQVFENAREGFKGPAQSTTGGMIRGAAQFLSAFVPAGRVLKAGKAAGPLARAAVDAAKGGIAGFAAFGAHEKGLADLMEEYPKLANPISKFLASAPDDTAAEGRLKHALEQAGIGVLADGVVMALGAMAKSRAVNNMANYLLKERGLVETSKEIHPTEMNVLGDTADAVLVREAEEKLDAAVEATAKDKPANVRGKLTKSPQFEINFARINTPEDVKTVLQKMATRHAKDIEEARRYKRSHALTEMAADQEQAFKLLVERRQGAAFNAEQTVAVRQLWHTSAMKLRDVAKLASQSPSEANLFQFRKMVAVHHMVQQEVLGARAEAGRALDAWKIPVGTGKELAKQIDNVLESNGGIKVTREMAFRIAALSDAGLADGVEKMVRGGIYARTADALAELWTNSLLSNVTTHTANILGNFGRMGMEIVDRATAEEVSTRMGTKDGVAAGEAMAMLEGMQQGFKEVLVMAAQKLPRSIADVKALPGKARDFLRGDLEAGVASKFDSPRGPAISSERFGISSEKRLGRAVDVIGEGTRAPTRLLQASDDIFRMVGYRMELRAQAVRRATAELRAGDIDKELFAQRVAEIIDNPPADIKLASVNQSTYMTFQNRPLQWMDSLGKGVQRIPIVGRLMLPFKNTPINILTYSLEHTPIAPAFDSWRADFFAGGARRDLAVAKMATGSSLLSLSMDLAMQGVITGKGPENVGQTQLYDRMGIQPYSFKMPGTDLWVSFNRLDPVGFLLGIGADMAEAVVNAQEDIDHQSFEKAMIAASLAIVKNVTSKTYLSGTSEFFSVVANPEMKGHGYVKRMMGSLFVPSGVAAAARLTDPTMRAADDIVDSLRRRIPALSNGLPPMRDLWGREKSYRSPMGAIYDAFMPVYVRREDKEPVDLELKRLKWFPEMPDRRQSFRGEFNAQETDIELDSAQYSRFMQLYGNEAKPPGESLGMKDKLNAIITGKHPLSPVYQMQGSAGGEDSGRALWIRQHVFRPYREAAKRQLMREDGNLRAMYDYKLKLKPGRLDPKLTGGAH